MKDRIKGATPWNPGRAASLLVFFSLIGLWELLSRLGVVSRLYFPPATDIIVVWLRLMADGVLPLALFQTFSRMACGYFAAAALMIPAGILLGVSPRLRALFGPSIELLRPLPPPAIIPAAMLFLGIGAAMKIFVVFFACSFPILINSLDGARGVPRLFADTGRTLGAGKARLFRQVILPAALPGVMSGLRVALPISLIVAVLSEMVGSVDGIGHFIVQMQRVFSIPQMYAGVATLGLAGWFFNALFMKADRKLLAWHCGWKKGGS